MNDLTKFWAAMDAETFERTRGALEASIQHWTENTKAEKPGAARTDNGACALCKEFFNVECKGCPVSANTGSESCISTPYEAAHNSLRYKSSFVGMDEFRLLAQDEVDFLKSLRPEHWGRKA